MQVCADIIKTYPLSPRLCADIIKKSYVISPYLGVNPLDVRYRGLKRRTFFTISAHSTMFPKKIAHRTRPYARCNEVNSTVSGSYVGLGGKESFPVPKSEGLGEIEKRLLCGW